MAVAGAKLPSRTLGQVEFWSPAVHGRWPKVSQEVGYGCPTPQEMEELAAESGVFRDTQVQSGSPARGSLPSAFPVLQRGPCSDAGFHADQARLLPARVISRSCLVRVGFCSLRSPSVGL